MSDDESKDTDFIDEMKKLLLEGGALPPKKTSTEDLLEAKAQVELNRLSEEQVAVMDTSKILAYQHGFLLEVTNFRKNFGQDEEGQLEKLNLIADSDPDLHAVLLDGLEVMYASIRMVNAELDRRIPVPNGEA